MENFHDLKDILQNLIEDLEEEIENCKMLLAHELFDNIVDKMSMLTDSLEAAKVISLALRDYQQIFGAGS
ncbi:MAG: hypothetical protein ACTSRP_06025 [Candidatus Helarchaeota archaeon]